MKQKTGCEQRPRARRAIAAIVVTALTACATASDDDSVGAPETTATTVERTASTPASSALATAPTMSPPASSSATTTALPTSAAEPDNAEEARTLVEELAAFGVGVHVTSEDAAPIVPVAEPVSPLALLEPQLAPLGAELRSGGGTLGADLDAASPMPAGSPPASYLVAAWVSKYDSPAATWAAARMGGTDAHDWTHASEIIFPRLLLMLFAGDVAREASIDPGTPEPQGFASGLASAATPAPRGPIAAVCGLSNWIDSTINAIFNALKTTGVLPPVVEFIVNGAIDLAQGVVQTVVDAIKLPLDVIVGAITLIGIVGMVSNLLTPWLPQLDITQPADHFGHPGGNEQAGELTLTFGPNSDLWALVGACVDAAGLALPSGRPPGARITWTPTASPLMASISADPTVRDDETATFRYVTAWEAVAPTPDSTIVNKYIWVTAKVEMISDDDIAKLTDLLFGQLPLGTLLAGLFAPTVQSLGAHLKANMYTVAPSEQLKISYHETPTPTLPPDTTTPTPTTPVSCPVGTWLSTDYTAENQVSDGGTGVLIVVNPDLTAMVDYTGSAPIKTQVLEPTAPVIRIEHSGGGTFRLDPVDGGWTIVDVVDQNYDATGTVTIAGQTIEFSDEEIEAAAKLFGDGSTGAASQMWCHPTDNMLFLSLAGYALQTFEPAP